MMPFRGNIKNPAYSPMKNHSRGMKIYTLNDSSTDIAWNKEFAVGNRQFGKF
jgi:hypothetical protein